MEVFNYNDWLDGKIVLKYDYFIPKGGNPILVGWDNFSDADILLIKAKQKEIFNERVANLLEKYKAIFNEELMSSKDTEEHRRMTISQIDDIFKGIFPTSQFISTVYWNVVFTYVELREIQEYYKRNIIRGVEVDYAFINSPSREFPKIDENYQVYAHTLYLFRKWIENQFPENPETKTDKLKTQLGQYGFFELPKIKKLSDPNKIKLVELISTNGLPYSIAMFDFLEFLEHMRKNHFTTHNQLNVEVARWFFASKDGRSVKGNISVLINTSTENREKYTSHIHKEQVQNDFYNLK